jgi:hypothetical protein
MTPTPADDTDVPAAAPTVVSSLEAGADNLNVEPKAAANVRRAVPSRPAHQRAVRRGRAYAAVGRLLQPHHGAIKNPGVPADSS